MSLRPDQSVHKILISTTSRLVGEYQNGPVLLTHSWPDIMSKSSYSRIVEGPASRSLFVFAFKIDPPEPSPGLVIPNYSPMGDRICSLLGVLFGKRFENHGLIEGSGFYYVPDLSNLHQLCIHTLPQNSHSPRVDFPVPLDLKEFSKIERLLLDDSLDKKLLNTFHGAAKFYLLALQNAEIDAETAYLNFITAGEILSNYSKYNKTDLLDTDTKKYLDDIELKIENGKSITKHFLGKFFFVKHRFVNCIMNFVDDEFFSRSESTECTRTVFT